MKSSSARVPGIVQATLSVMLGVCWLGGCGNSAGGTPPGTGGQTTPVTSSGGEKGSGGSQASGGTTSSSGQTGSGGAATGGSSATGGRSGSGGVSGNGGATSSGGTVGSGGRTGTGGSTVVGTGGETPVSGGSRSGGTTGSGGAATGGTVATGGTRIGGAPGTGGAVRDGGPDSSDGGSPGTCPATVMKSGDSNQTVKVGTANRTYILHIPTGYTGTKPLPLVIDYHALGGTGSGQKSLSGWDKKGDANMFITAFPDSASNGSNGWNVGMCCQSAQSNQVDDVGFVREMIKAIEAVACVDPKRIYVSGCSNGGGMSYKTACDLADIVAAAAPVDFRCVYGGTTASPSCAGCKPSRPISIIHFDNTGDTSLVPYNGGMTSFAADCPPNQSCTGMGFPSATDNFNAWQSLDGCTGTTAPKVGGCSTNSTCSGGAEVMMCVASGGSHCGNYGTLKIVDTAWTEFQKLSLP
jgi:polyhydroxybutyrate depolymerase